MFLITGEQQYHIILETLNTAEATYVWHMKKDLRVLKDKIILINNNLNTIRNHGWKVFLECSPDNFSKILHEYSEGRKGFIKWKHMLEERLV